jgi:hypothetical protein
MIGWVFRLMVLAISGALLLACDTVRGGEMTPAEGAMVRTTHVDSILPLEEEIRRFRLTLGDEPTVLSGGGSSRDALVEAFLDALEWADTATLREMTLTREEFGYLYYPETHYTERPYELSPALVWFQLENYGNRGFQRALRRFSGRALGSTGYRCKEEPLVQGENRIWTNCLIEIGEPAGGERQLSLFGAILERQGHFKFLSYANRLASGGGE